MKKSSALLLLLACQGEAWRNADLQLDVTDAGLLDTDVVRVCARGYRPHEEAVGAGRVAFPGLLPDRPVEVQVDLLEPADEGPSSRRLGRAGPVTLSPDTPYVEAPFVPCTGEACEACAGGQGANPGDESWLLAVRFVD